MPQGRLVVGVGQHAHIKNIIGIARNASFERKRLEHQGQLSCRRGKKRFHISLQQRASQQAGVDHMGLLAQCAQQLAFELNCVHQRPTLVQLQR